ncbi:MAG: AcrB/AcrD/AcrF family protein [Planctomycetota bacterium]|nr:MAG: AcrB/AcrD/AcrF family protein [Planctomycetota bacterium]
MRSLVRFSVGNPVASNLLFLAILGIGGMYVGSLPREVFPEFSKETAEVQVIYPNASPEEVERLCTIPIEEAADSLQGADEITSFSQHGFARVFIRLAPGTEMQAFLDELRMEVDAIQDWPEDAEDPRIFEQKVNFPVISINLYGNVEERKARAVAETVRERVKSISNVSAVSLFGVRDPEIWLEIEPWALEKHDLSLAEISAAMGLQVRDFPGGNLETDAGQVVLRVLGEETDPEVLAHRVVRSYPDGRLLRVRDIGQVSHDFEQNLTFGRYNGFESLTLQISKDRKGDVIDIVEEVDRVVEEMRPGLPPGLSLGVSSDFSIYVKNRLNTLLQSGMFGLALVMIILWIFLDARAALMTALGIPVALMGGVLCMSLLGITMNMLSMFAFILVLGLVVDDAIVVVENCYRYLERGLKPVDAAMAGAIEVAWPVLTTVATTTAAFGSMLLIEGELGRWMEPVPKVALLTLFASLFEALIVLPSHFAEWVKPMQESAGKVARTSSTALRTEGRWYSGVQRVYIASLRTSMRHRYSVFMSAVALAAGAGALFHSGHIKFVLMPKFEAKLFFVNVETPTTYSLEQTSDALKPLDNAVGDLPTQELESFVTLAGATYRDQDSYRSGNHLGQIFVELAEGEGRKRSTQEIQDYLREAFRGMPGILRLDFSEPQAGPGGPAIEIRLLGAVEEELRAAAAEIKKYLVGFTGVVDVRDDLLPGSREVRLKLTDQGRMMGFDETRLARQVLGAFAGDRASILRLDRDPADLLIRNPETARYDFRLLREMRVFSPAGESVPLERVALLEESRGLAQITRRDRLRSVTVTADVTLEGNPRDITTAVMEKFSGETKPWPGVSLDFGGDRERTVESIQSMIRAMGLSFLVIYMMLALLFRSYLQPVVVLTSVPFAFLGVIFGFTLIGQPLSFMTLLGVLALSGVAVNDALVLVDFINKHRQEGHGLLASVLRAGAVRMRPVLITSMTTIGGLIPLAFFSSGQAKFLSPMAQSLIFGMVTATLMTLILVPCGYLILNDWRRLGGRILRALGPS